MNSNRGGRHLPRHSAAKSKRHRPTFLGRRRRRPQRRTQRLSLICLLILTLLNLLILTVLSTIIQANKKAVAKLQMKERDVSCPFQTLNPKPCTELNCWTSAVPFKP